LPPPPCSTLFPYTTLFRSLLSGMGPNGGRSSDFAEGKTMEAVSHLNPDQVTADLNAAADYALKFPASNGKLFVGGYCWGGSQTLDRKSTRLNSSHVSISYA